MKLRVLVFGAAQDIVEGREIEVELPGKSPTAGELKRQLRQKYPDLNQLVSFLIAVNSEYADDDMAIKAGDEIALIPPTSGG